MSATNSRRGLGREGSMDSVEVVMNDATMQLLHWASTQPNAHLLITRGRVYSYAEFTRRALVIVGLLRSAGFLRGRRVALFLEEYDQFFVSMFGIWLAGGVVVPLNTTLPGKDIDWLIAKAHPAFLVVTDEARCRSDGPIRIVLPSDNGNLVAPGKPVAEDELSPVRPDELAMIMFTSGTTGLPKGVCQTLSCISANAGNVALTLGVGSADRIFLNIPPYFTSAICHFLTLMTNGGGVAAQLGFFFGDNLLAKMEELGCTGFGGAPTHLVRVVETMKAPREHGIRFWISSGDHLPLHVSGKLRRMLPGVRLFNMYGLTEVGGRLCILPPEETDVRIGSVGRPIADMAVIARDPERNLLPAGTVGELYVTGSLLMQGYLDEPKITADTLTDHGLRSGDFGWVDENGYVWISGRKDDIIKCGGEKVSTIQVQQALVELDIFADVAVIAAPDAILGHVPIACVVPKNTEDFKASKVLRRLKALLPGASLPSRIVAVREIPRTGSGKVIRVELQKLLGDTSGWL